MKNQKFNLLYNVKVAGFPFLRKVEEYDFDSIAGEDAKKIAEEYIKIYDENDDNEAWFNKVKDLAGNTTSKEGTYKLGVKHTLTYNNNGGSGCSSVTKNYNESWGTLCTPSRTGYTFTGWNGTDIADHTMNVTIPVNSIGARTYTATYEVNEYHLYYTLNGGTATNPETYTVEDTFTLNNPTKTGYTFLGWTGACGETPILNVTISNEIEDKTYIANYNASVELFDTLKEGVDKTRAAVKLKLDSSNFTDVETKLLLHKSSILDNCIDKVKISLDYYKFVADYYKGLK